MEKIINDKLRIMHEVNNNRTVFKLSKLVGYGAITRTKFEMLMLNMFSSLRINNE